MHERKYDPKKLYEHIKGLNLPKDNSDDDLNGLKSFFDAYYIDKEILALKRFFDTYKTLDVPDNQIKEFKENAMIRVAQLYNKNLEVNIINLEEDVLNASNPIAYMGSQVEAIVTKFKLRKKLKDLVESYDDSEIQTCYLRVYLI